MVRTGSRASGAAKKTTGTKDSPLQGTDDPTTPTTPEGGADASANGAVKAKASFALERIGTELPPEEPRSRVATRTDLLNNLRAIQNEPNVWFKVAEYATANGATRTLTALQEGKITAPEGPGEYDVETRRGPKRDNGKRGSLLFALYVLEDVPKEDDSAG